MAGPGEVSAPDAREWRAPGRRLDWVMAVCAAGFVVLALLDLVDGSLGQAAWRAALGGLLVLQMWLGRATRTTVDTAGLHVRQPPSRPVDLAWDEVADITVRRQPRVPPRIVVETTAGAQHRPLYVPVEDVRELRAWWQVHRSQTPSA